MTDKPKVVGIRLSSRQLQKHIHAAARDSSRVAFKEPPDRDNLAGELTYRQALKCLQSGQIVGQPVLDEHGFWRFRMLRHAAGLAVCVEAAARAAGARVEQIVVLGIEAQ